MLMNVNDPRGAKAVALATDAGQWIKVRDNLGRKAYGIPSSEAGRYYLVTRESCTCPAFEFGRGRDCKHIVAVRLHCEYVAEQEARASVGADNVAHLDLTLAAVRSAAAQAAKCDDIFARFDDDPKPLLRILGKPAKGFAPIVRED